MDPSNQGYSTQPRNGESKLSAVQSFRNTGNSSVTVADIGEFRRALPQFIAVSIKNILLFVYGMTLGFPTIVIPAIQGGKGKVQPNDIVLNTEEISWFSSINLICVPLGCVFSGLLTQPIGKRRAMQFVNLPILASWLLFYFATETVHLYAALCLSGLGGGLMEAPVLTYVAEITEPKYRGILSVLGSTCVISGVFIQFIMGSLMTWRTVAAVSSIFPVISILTLFFVPESPTWLIRNQQYNEATRALQWLRGWVPEKNIKEEFDRLYDELITQPALEDSTITNPKGTGSSLNCGNRCRMFTKRSFVAPFLLVSYTFFTGHFSGKTSLQTYAVQIFHTLKAPINKYYATILLGVAELVATVSCVFLIHFTGKRPLVLISTIGVSLCFFGTATYAFYLNVVPGFAVDNVVANASALLPKESTITHSNISELFQNYNQEIQPALNETSDVQHDNVDFTTISYENQTEPELPKESTIQSHGHNDILMTLPKQTTNNLAWLPLIFLLGAAFFSHFGIRMIPWILIGEVFPASVRSTASGLVSGLGYIFGFLANKLFLQMLANLTLPGTFWFYSAVALVGAIVLYFVLPETEGRTLGEIEAHFSKKSPVNLLRKKYLNNQEVIIKAIKDNGHHSTQETSETKKPESKDAYNNLAFEMENVTTRL